MEEWELMVLKMDQANGQTDRDADRKTIKQRNRQLETRKEAQQTDKKNTWKQRNKHKTD